MSPLPARGKGDGGAHAVGKRQRRERHSARVQYVGAAALRMQAIKAADHRLANHIHHRLRRRPGHGFDRAHAFLNQNIAHFHAAFCRRHFRALFAVERARLVGAFDADDAQSVSPRVRLDDDKRLFGDAARAVVRRDLRDGFFHRRRQTFHPFAAHKIDSPTHRKIGAQIVRAHARDGGGELFADSLVMRKMLRFAPRLPAQLNRRQSRDFQIREKRRRAFGKIVV